MEMDALVDCIVTTPRTPLILWLVNYEVFIQTDEAAWMKCFNLRRWKLS